MKTYNLYYDELFFETNLVQIAKKQKSYSSIIVQIFSFTKNKKLILIIQKKLKKHLSKAKIIGSSSDGEFIGSKVTTDKIVISITFFKETAIETFSLNYISNDSATLANQLASQIPSNPKAFILFASGKDINGEDLIESIHQSFPQTIISGGLAAGEDPVILDDENIFSNAVVGVALYNPNLIIQTLSKSGWVPIGREMRITKVDKNRVYTIDNKFAIDIYRYYLGNDISKMLPKIGMEFPLISKDLNKVRALLSVNDDGSLTFAGNFQKGERVYFAHGSRELFLGQSLQIPKELQHRYFESIFIYSCMARRRLMPDGIYREIEPFTLVANVSGFFTHGEFFCDDKGCIFLNQTLSAIAMSEDSTSTPIKKVLLKSDDKEYYYSQKAMMHLINRATQEIEILNENLEKNVAQKIEELRKKDHLLLERSKLASLGEMIGNIAHQWRQPLNAMGVLNMQVQSILAQQGSIDAKEYAQIADAMDAQLDFMSTTIDDFRVFVKDGSTKEEFNPIQSIEKVISLIKPHFSSQNIEISLTYSKTVPQFKGILSEFKHVIINILNNAKDAIIANRKSKNEQHYIFIAINQNTITITDSGGGIDETIQNKIFEPYFSTKFKNQGTGIGLYMSYEIITKHFDGDMRVCNVSYKHNNKKYTGAKFTISFSDTI